MKTVLHMVVASLFGIVLYCVFENNGLKYISASEASIIVATIPIFTLLMDTLVDRQKLDLKTLLLVLGSWVGVYLVISGDGPVKLGSGNLKGSLMVFGAMVSWIIFTLITKRLSQQYDSLQMTFSQTLLSIPLFIPFIWQERTLWHWPSVTASAHLLFLGVFCSAVAYVFFLNGIHILGPGVASSYLNLIPLVTMAVGALFLGDRMAPLQLGGAVLILVSLGLISFFRLRLKKSEKIAEPLAEEQEKAAS
jgi:drug/metabolite transporter (DMT)-like permease